jgi:hypothetical protein
MATTPAVKASTEIKGRGNGDELLKAIAETMQAGSEGRKGLEKIKEHLQSREKAQREKAMKRRK